MKVTRAALPFLPFCQRLLPAADGTLPGTPEGHRPGGRDPRRASSPLPLRHHPGATSPRPGTADHGRRSPTADGGQAPGPPAARLHRQPLGLRPAAPQPRPARQATDRALNYSPLTCDIRAAAELLGRRIEEICERTGAQQIDVVGHSLGGLIARYYVQRLGGDTRVRTLVTLGTPHSGTRVAPWRTRTHRAPDAPRLTGARGAHPAAPDCRTHFVSFWSDLDHVMDPLETACIDHPDLTAQNVRVTGIGHLALPCTPQSPTEYGRSSTRPTRVNRPQITAAASRWPDTWPDRYAHHIEASNKLRTQGQTRARSPPKHGRMPVSCARETCGRLSRPRTAGYSRRTALAAPVVEAKEKLVNDRHPSGTMTPAPASDASSAHYASYGSQEARTATSPRTATTPPPDLTPPGTRPTSFATDPLFGDFRTAATTRARTTPATGPPARTRTSNYDAYAAQHHAAYDTGVYDTTAWTASSSRCRSSRRRPRPPTPPGQWDTAPGSSPTSRQRPTRPSSGTGARRPSTPAPTTPRSGTPTARPRAPRARAVRPAREAFDQRDRDVREAAYDESPGPPYRDAAPDDG